jgi:hypothetical protein
MGDKIMLYFLSSIPRSGSTLLASLLGQRDDTYVSPTSNLGEILGSVVKAFEASVATKASGKNKAQLYKSLKAICDSQYRDRTEEVVFDKGREWPASVIMETMEKSIGDIKIVATVRPMAECIASFYEVDNKDIPIKQWMKESTLMEHLMFSYDSLKDGYEKYPDKFCIIEYDNLVNHTQRELDRVADFIGIDRVTYSPDIEQVDENDNAWGIKDLHKLEPEIKATEQDTKAILGDEMYEHFQGGEFWNDKPEPIKNNKPLDFALECALRGETEKAYQILKEEEKQKPDCDRVKFNLGWHEMERGNLLKGHRLMAQGRNEGVFGSPQQNVIAPLWNGERDCTVFMKMEGGFGDQIHGIRYAKNIEEYGNKVIVSGSEELTYIFKDLEGVTVFGSHEMAPNIYHDYWYPNMSITIPLELEWSDVSGKPYIKRDGESEGKIGLKWNGNPEFEHEQHRLFPTELMWKVAKGFEDQCISLQKEGDCPDWMEKPSLETWGDTKKQISRCDLIITSCTSVAHLAGAMGIETWVLVPIMPYYLWSYPGNKSPFYNSIKLFRQEKYGDWGVPFKRIKQDLISRKVALWNKLPMGEITKSFIEA